VKATPQKVAKAKKQMATEVKRYNTQQNDATQVAVPQRSIIRARNGGYTVDGDIIRYGNTSYNVTSHTDVKRLQ